MTQAHSLGSIFWLFVKATSHTLTLPGKVASSRIKCILHMNQQRQTLHIQHLTNLNQIFTAAKYKSQCCHESQVSPQSLCPALELEECLHIWIIHSLPIDSGVHCLQQLVFEFLFQNLHIAIQNTCNVPLKILT